MIQDMTREELKEKVANRFNLLIEKYSHSAQRGIKEIEKEMEMVTLQAEDTTISANERMLNMMLTTVVLTSYAYELENQGLELSLKISGK